MKTPIGTPAERLARLPEHFFATLNQRLATLKAAGRDLIHLDVGSPDLPPPDEVVAALQRLAADPASHGYQSHRWPETYRQAWRRFYARHYRVELNPQREITPLIGSKEGIFHLTMALINPGDVVLIPDPGYLTYTRAALLAGGEPYSLRLDTKTSFLPALDAIPGEIARRARLLWLNYPNNPTGATATREFFAEALAFGQQHGILVCQDAAYAQVTFDGYRAPSLLELPGALQVGLEFNTLSKSHNMAGWRVGAALGNAEAIEALFKMKTHADSAHFLPVIQAAALALETDDEWLASRNAIYQRRRDVLVQGLRRLLGFEIQPPLAALYVWCPTPAGTNSVEFATRLLEQTSVSVTPGVVFGAGGEGFIRISITAPLARLQEAIFRMEEWQRDEPQIFNRR
jgi:LL-diaminopimelate aminotransferase